MNKNTFAEQLFETFPVIRKTVGDYLRAGPNMSTEAGQEMSFEYEAKVKVLLEGYTTKLSKDELKDRLKVLSSLRNTRMEWEPEVPHILWLHFIAEKIVYKALGRLGGEATKANQPKEYFRNIRRRYSKRMVI